MNNRRRQQLRALDMMIRSKSKGKVGYNALLKFANGLMDAITEAFAQVSSSLIDLGETIQPFVQMMEAGKQLEAAQDYEDPAEEESCDRSISCESCYHYLGGGCCRINLESECREGGGFEAWTSQSTPELVPEAITESNAEPDTAPESEDKPDLAETIPKWASIGICILAYPLVIYKLYEWIKYLFF